MRCHWCLCKMTVINPKGDGGLWRSFWPHESRGENAGDNFSRVHQRHCNAWERAVWRDGWALKKNDVLCTLKPTASTGQDKRQGYERVAFLPCFQHFQLTYRSQRKNEPLRKVKKCLRLKHLLLMEMLKSAPCSLHRRKSGTGRKLRKQQARCTSRKRK